MAENEQSPTPPLDGGQDGDEVRLRELLQPLLTASDKTGLSRSAAEALLDGIIVMCCKDAELLQGCIQQLTKPPTRRKLRKVLGRHALWKILERRYFLQPLLYIAIVTARLERKLALTVLLRDGDDGAPVWPHNALGADRIRRMVMGSFLRNHALAAQSAQHCLFLLRMSPHWRADPVVGAVAKTLEESVKTHKATKAGRRAHTRMLDPIKIDGVHRDGRTGRPSSSPRDHYLAERRAELEGEPYLSDLYEEVCLLHGNPDIEPESMRKRLQRFRKTSPIWVDVAEEFAETPLGKCLTPLTPPPISRNQLVSAVLTKQSGGEEASE